MYTCTNVKMYLLYIHLECMHEKCVYIDGHILTTSIFSKISKPVLRTYFDPILRTYLCVLSLNLEHQKNIYLEHLLIFRILRT